MEFGFWIAEFGLERRNSGYMIQDTRCTMQDLSNGDFGLRNLDWELDIHGCLVEILETDEIDLVILNTASLPLQARIIRDKKTLVDKDPFLRHRFESLILRQYADFSIKEMQILERRYFGDRQSSHSEKSLRA